MILKVNGEPVTGQMMGYKSDSNEFVFKPKQIGQLENKKPDRLTSKSGGNALRWFGQLAR